MTEFAYAQAVDGEPRALAEHCADQLSEADGHNLGFVYVTSPLAGSLEDIVAVLKERTGVADWLGTVGIGICATGAEYFDTSAIVALTGRVAGDSYRLIESQDDPDDVADSVDPDFVPMLGVVHGDPRNPQTGDIVSALARDHGAYLVGGLTAAEEIFPQIVGQVVDGGVSGVLLGSDLGVAVGLTQGCSPIGPSHQVTRSAGNVLLMLDDRPALEVLSEDLGVADGVDPMPWLANVHAALPVMGSDTGDYLVRNLIGIEPSQGLVVIGDDADAGSRLFFVRRDGESAAKDLQRMLADLKSRVSGTPKAGLYFSCVARGPNLFEGESFELAAIQEAFGDIPIVGFFGNGEISNDRVYGYTGVLTLFT